MGLIAKIRSWWNKRRKRKLRKEYDKARRQGNAKKVNKLGPKIQKKERKIRKKRKKK